MNSTLNSKSRAAGKLSKSPVVRYYILLSTFKVHLRNLFFFSWLLKTLPFPYFLFFPYLFSSALLKVLKVVKLIFIVLLSKYQLFICRFPLDVLRIHQGSKILQVEIFLSLPLLQIIEPLICLFLILKTIQIIRVDKITFI